MNLENLTDDLSVIQIPEKIRNHVVSQEYWQNEVTAICYAVNTKLPENLQSDFKYASSFIVKIKANKNGVYLNDNCVLEWSNNASELQDVIIYETSIGVRLCFSDDERNRIGVTDLDSYHGYLDCNPEIVDDFCKNREEKKKTFISNFAKDFPFWEKWSFCLVKRNEDKGPTLKGQVKATRDGVYSENYCRLKWSDLIVVKIEDKTIYFTKGSLFENGGNPSSYIMKEGGIAVPGELYIIPEGIELSVSALSPLPIAKFELSDYWPEVKDNYETLAKNADGNVQSKEYEFHMNDGNEDAHEHISTLKLIFGKTESGLHRVFLQHAILFSGGIDFSKKAAILTFGDGSSLELSSPNHNYENNVSIDYYALTLVQLHQIANKRKLSIRFSNNHTYWDLQANQLCGSARAFEKEIFEMPSHLVTFLEARIEFDNHNFEKADELVIEALKEKPENLYYQDMHTTIHTMWQQWEQQDVEEVKKLFTDKKYEEATEKAAKIVKKYNKPEYLSLKEEITIEFAESCYLNAQSLLEKKDFVTAYEKITNAIKLNDKPEYKELCEIVKNGLINFYLNNAERQLTQKRFSQMSSTADKILKIDAKHKRAKELKDIAEKEENKVRLYTFIAIVIVTVVAIIICGIYALLK